MGKLNVDDALIIAGSDANGEHYTLLCGLNFVYKNYNEKNGENREIFLDEVAANFSNEIATRPSYRRVMALIGHTLIEGKCEKAQPIDISGLEKRLSVKLSRLPNGGVAYMPAASMN